MVVVLWDVTCLHTLATSYLDKAVTGPGVVAETEAQTKKGQKYLSVDDSTYIFQPIAIETIGAFGSSAIELFIYLYIDLFIPIITIVFIVDEKN